MPPEKVESVPEPVLPQPDFFNRPHPFLTHPAEPGYAGHQLRNAAQAR